MPDGNGHGGNGKVEHFTDSVWLRLVMRTAIIAATAALPVFGWLLSRGVASVDDISRKVDFLQTQALETNGTVKLIQQTQSVQTQILADHEARMRLLERVVPLPPPRPQLP